MERDSLISLYEYKDNEEAVFRIFIAALQNKIDLFVQSISFTKMIKLSHSHIQKIRSMHPEKVEIDFGSSIAERLSILSHGFNPKIATKQMLNFTDVWANKEEIFNILKPTPHPNATRLNETERNNMLKLILGMAISSFSYNPQDPKNHATGNKAGSIKSELSIIGLPIDEDTVRKYLKEAKEQFPHARPREKKKTLVN